MYAPPGVDSDSSGEDTTPPPTPPPPKAPRPHFKFSSLFTPTRKLDLPPSPASTASHGKTTEKREEPAKEDAKKEEIKPTKKGVRIFAGELLGQKGSRAEGLTTTRGDRVEPEPPSPPVEDASFGAPHPEMIDVQQDHADASPATGVANEVLVLLRQLVADTHTKGKDKDFHGVGDSVGRPPQLKVDKAEPPATPSTPFSAPPIPTFQAIPPHICYGPGPWMGYAPPGWDGLQGTYPGFVGGQPVSAPLGTASQVGADVFSPTPLISSSPNVAGRGVQKEGKEKKTAGGDEGELSKKIQGQSTKDGLGERKIELTSIRDPTTSGTPKSSADYSTLKKSLDRYKTMYRNAVKRYEAGGEPEDIMKDLKAEVKMLEVKIKEIKAKMEKYERATTSEKTSAPQAAGVINDGTTDSPASNAAKPSKAAPPDPPSNLEADVTRYKSEYAKVLKKYKDGEGGDDMKSQLKDQLNKLESKIKKATGALGQSKKSLDANTTSETSQNVQKSKSDEPSGSTSAVRDISGGLPSKETKQRQESSPGIPPAPKLEDDIKQCKHEYSKAMKAYQNDGIKSEEKKVLKVRLKKLEEKIGKLSGTGEAKSTQDKPMPAEYSQDTSGDHKGTSQDGVKEDITSSSSTREPATDGSVPAKRLKTDKSSSDPLPSGISRSKLASDVSRYKDEYQTALDMYKKGNISDKEEEKRVKEQVRDLESKFKKALAMLEQANKELEATSDVVDQGSKEKLEPSQTPALKVSSGATTIQSPLREPLPAESVSSTASSGSPSSMQLQSDIKWYKTEYDEVLKSYQKADLVENEKKRLKHELKRLEDKINEASKLSGQANDTDDREVTLKEGTAGAKTNQTPNPPREPAANSTALSPRAASKQPDRSDPSASTNDITAEQLKEKAAKYETQYRHIVKAYKQDSLPEGEKSRLEGEMKEFKLKLKIINGRLEAGLATKVPKGLKQSVEEKAREKDENKAEEKTDEYAKVELEKRTDKRAEETVQSVDTSKRNTLAVSGLDTGKSHAPESGISPNATAQGATKPSSSSPNLQEYVKKYKAAYALAVNAYKQDGLSDEERRKRKEKVRRADEKLKEATQALETSTSDGETKHRPPEKTKQPSGGGASTSEPSKAPSKSSSPVPPTASDAERYVVQYKAAYQLAMKEYKASGLSDGERKDRKEKVRRAEEKLKEAMQAVAEEPKKIQEGRIAEKVPPPSGTNIEVKEEALRMDVKVQADPTKFKSQAGDQTSEASAKCATSSVSPKALSSRQPPTSPPAPQDPAEMDKLLKHYKGRYATLVNAMKEQSLSAEKKEAMSRQAEGLKARVKAMEVEERKGEHPREVKADRTGAQADLSESESKSEGKAVRNDSGALPVSPKPVRADKTTILAHHKAEYARLTKSIKDDLTAHDRAEKIKEADKLKSKIKSLMADLPDSTGDKKQEILASKEKAIGKAGTGPPARELTRDLAQVVSDERRDKQKGPQEETWAPLSITKSQSPADKQLAKSVSQVSPKQSLPREILPTSQSTWSSTLVSLAKCIDLANTILNTLHETTPEGSSILSTLVSRIMTSLLMQQDIIQSMRKILGDENSEASEEFVRHLSVVKNFLEGLYLGHGTGRTKEVREENLEVISIQSIIEYLLGLTDYLTPGMIAVARRTFDAWRTDGFTLQSFVQAIMGVRKEVRAIHDLKAREREEDGAQKAKGLMSVLDMLLAFISPEPSQHDEREREELITVSQTREVHRSSKRLTYIKGVSPDTDSSKALGSSETEHHHTVSDILHLPSRYLDSSTSSTAPSATRSGPKPIVITAEEHVHHTSKADISHSPLKLPQKTQDFLNGSDEPPQTLGQDTKSPQNLTFNDDERHRRLHREGSTDTDISPSRVITFNSSTLNSSKSSVPNAPEDDIWSAPSRYSQSSASSSLTATPDGTVKSDRHAARLLAQADSGPLPVRHDKRDEVDDMLDEEQLEPSAEEVKRAEDVLYNKALSPGAPVRPARRVADRL
ncbi:hypothetical protein L198_06195 [Cryptococcus wingfieldii CBS 7118]|uniref:Uncharacterized protein n=1 Tax=Cryptococcus wingfieldii CBS 7118 TaxID=1295528 RepID=A0A1E3INJ4_9TREE|nr:hypothetical protein L198_06195 [Cryptococcus wingfieldii CBS 7118]ODN90177.1 hypothetical protein L198_06195 [Cryptococcus wingfieldii CBS 7118]